MKRILFSLLLALSSLPLAAQERQLREATAAEVTAGTLGLPAVITPRRLVGGGGTTFTTNYYYVGATNIVDYSDIGYGTVYTNTSGSNLLVVVTVGIQSATATQPTLFVSPLGNGVFSSILKQQIDGSTNTVEHQIVGMVVPGASYYVTNPIATAGSVSVMQYSSQRIYSGIGAVTGGGGGSDPAAIAAQVRTNGNEVATAMTNRDNSFVGSFGGNGGALTNVNLNPPTTLFVDTVRGSVSGVRGDQTRPFANITNAVQAAQPFDTIYLAAGQTNNVYTTMNVSNLTIIGWGSRVSGDTIGGSNLFNVYGDLNLFGGTYSLTNDPVFAGLKGIPFHLLGAGQKMNVTMMGCKFFGIGDVILSPTGNNELFLYNSEFDSYWDNVAGTVKGKAIGCTFIAHASGLGTNATGLGLYSSAFTVSPGSTFDLIGCKLVSSNATFQTRGVSVGSGSLVNMTGCSLLVGSTNAGSTDRPFYLDGGNVVVNGSAYPASYLPWNFQISGGLPLGQVKLLGDVTNSQAQAGSVMVIDSSGERTFSQDLHNVTNFYDLHVKRNVTLQGNTNYFYIGYVGDQEFHGWWKYSGNGSVLYTNINNSSVALANIGGDNYFTNSSSAPLRYISQGDGINGHYDSDNGATPTPLPTFMDSTNSPASYVFDGTISGNASGLTFSNNAVVSTGGPFATTNPTTGKLEFTYNGKDLTNLNATNLFGIIPKAKITGVGNYGVFNADGEYTIGSSAQYSAAYGIFGNRSSFAIYFGGSIGGTDAFINSPSTGLISIKTNLLVYGTITATNGVASYSTATALQSGATGITNNLTVNCTVWLTAATGLSMSNNAGGTIFSGQSVSALTPFNLQPGGKLVGTSITCVGTNGF